jgi:hypothetical protein
MDARLSRTRPTTMVVALTLSLFFVLGGAKAWALPDYDGDGVVGAADCNPLDGGVAPGKPDRPDLAFEDTNCDGIDGDVAHAIFVSLSGNDAAPGTMANPKRTIGAGIAAAKAQGKDVYVSGGVYDGQVGLEDNVGVYGGYAPGSGQRSTSEITTIRNLAGEAVIGDGDTGVVLQFLTLEGNAPAAAGSTAYGLRAIASSSISLEGVKATGGAGRNGPNQGQPTQADAGTKGSDGGGGGYGGFLCSFRGIGCPGGGGGGGTGGRSGGLGGAGSKGFAAGGNGQQGGGDSGGAFGFGACITFRCSANGGKGGDATVTGTVGGPGASATFSIANGGATWTNGSTGSFVAAQGTNGTAGFGGGGGGGGRGNTDCNGDNVYAGGGGGGGGGGQGGAGGNGGGNGGGSFAVYLHNSNVVIDGTQAIPGQLQTGNGGTGGTGGLGGLAGGGGDPGLGAAGASFDPGCGSVTWGGGGDGGHGSAGGAGGPGGGGAGGPSAGVFRAGTSKFVLKTIAATIGNGGTGGARGGGGSAGGSGQKGTTLPTTATNDAGLDFDGDGVKDVGDACPSIAAPGDADGCPDRPAKLADSDGDQIPDGSDACPGTPRGDVDANEDGCPDPVDGDGDGFPSTSDCNDANPAINPGKPEIAENGIDENCDGFDGVNLDRDGDGFQRPADCNDNNPAIRPGVPDIPDNNVDENCDGSDAKTPPLPQNSALLSYSFKPPGKKSTKFTLFQVKNVPTGSSIAISCKKCPKAARKITKRNAKGTVTIKQLKTLIKAGSSIQVTVTKPGTIGVVKILAVRSKKAPKLTTKCLQPGASKPSSCAK